MAVSNVLKMTFSTAEAGVNFLLSLKYAKEALKETGGLATIQTAAAGLIAQQPFDNITLGSFVSAEFVTTTSTPVEA